MKDTQLLSKALSTSDSAVIKSIVNRTLIVEWGTIKKVVSDGVVEVLLSVTDKPQNTTVIVCTLLSPCSSSVSIKMKPKAGDKVLVLSPRRFSVDMFDVSTADTDDTEVILEPYFTGYNKLSCVAILYNQFRESSHKNTIVVDNDGAVSVKLAYDKANDKNKLTVTTDKNGACTVTNEKGTVTLKADGYLDYQQTEEGNETQFTFSDSGFTIEDKAGNNIVSSTTSGSENITINGNLKVKK